MAEHSADVRPLGICSTQRDSSSVFFMDDNWVLSGQEQQASAVCSSCGVDAALGLYAGVRTGVFLDSGCMQLFLEHRILLVYNLAGALPGKRFDKCTPKNTSSSDSCFRIRRLVRTYLLCYAVDSFLSSVTELDSYPAISPGGSGRPAFRLRRIPVPDARSGIQAFPAPA